MEEYTTHQQAKEEKSAIDDAQKTTKKHKKAPEIASRFLGLSLKG